MQALNLFIVLDKPWFLLLLLVIPALVIWYALKNKSFVSRMFFPSADGFESMPKSFRQRLIHIPFILRMMTLALLIFILSGPHSRHNKSRYKVEGIDIMMAMDISGSMLAEDFKPNRLEASRDVAVEFINGRPDDRMGLVIFSSEAFLQCPLTNDHNTLKQYFSEVRSGMIADGTAIGDGLGLAVSHIRRSKALSKVIILLTDGINNTGSMDPLTAAEIAKKFGIRVYTIGVGTRGKAPYPFQTPFGIQYQSVDVQIDESLLSQIAEYTGGKYFRATDKNKLREIYGEIDLMEKSKIDVTRFDRKNEEYLIFALIALGLFITELMLRYLVLRKIP